MECRVIPYPTLDEVIMPLTLQMFFLMHMIRDSFIYTNVIDTERRAVV